MTHQYRLAARRVQPHLALENREMGSLFEREIPFPHFQALPSVQPLWRAVAVPRNRSAANERRTFHCSAALDRRHFGFEHEHLAAEDHSDIDPLGCGYQLEQMWVAKEDSQQQRASHCWAPDRRHSGNLFVERLQNAAMKAVQLHRQRRIPTNDSCSN